MNKRIVIGNWKMNPSSEKDAVTLARRVDEGVGALKRAAVLIAPPHVFLRRVVDEVGHVGVGTQDAFWEPSGPYTGEVSYQQAKSAGAEFVIVGHSERRIYLGESGEMIAKKLKAVLSHGMKGVLCIGERERVDREVASVVGDQLLSALEGAAKNDIGRLIVAYEPVWATSTVAGSGPDTPQSAAKTALYIKKILVSRFGTAAGSAVPVVYGGSVNVKNAESFMREGMMAGVLVGGASIDAKAFVEIAIRVADF